MADPGASDAPGASRPGRGQMTWRERILAARERGSFTMEDMDAWREPATCLVGEQRRALGVYVRLDLELGARDIQKEMCLAITRNDFDGLDRLLDFTEDRALELKRGGRHE